MDLNEKLAARRKELAIEEAKTAQAVAAAAEESKKALQAAVDAEVAKRLTEMGMGQPKQKQPDVSDQQVNELADKKIDEALTKAAQKRMTGLENATLWALVALGIFGFFIAWWVGLGFWVWAAIHLSSTTDKHKKQIMAEGKANHDVSSETVQPK